MTWSRVTTTEGTMKNAPSYPISSGLEAGYTTPPFIPASTTSAASGFLVNLQVVCKLSGINSYKFISGSLNYSFTENAGTCTAPPEDNLFQVDNFITTTQVIVGSKGPIVKFVLGNGKL